MHNPVPSSQTARGFYVDKLSFIGVGKCGGLWPPNILRMQGVRIATSLRSSQ